MLRFFSTNKSSKLCAVGLPLVVEATQSSPMMAEKVRHSVAYAVGLSVQKCEPASNHSPSYDWPRDESPRVGPRAVDRKPDQFHDSDARNIYLAQQMEPEKH